MMIKDRTCRNTLYLMVSIFPNGMATSVGFKVSPPLCGCKNGSITAF